MEQFTFHMGLHVKDIERTTAFYTRLFGLEPLKTKPGYAKYELDNPALVISFIESELTGPQFGHFGIRVNTQEQLTQKKKEIESLLHIEVEEENVSCCYAYQNKFWVKDPDGYEWEVYHFLKDDDKIIDTSSEERKDLVGCC